MVESDSSASGIGGLPWPAVARRVSSRRPEGVRDPAGEAVGHAPREASALRLRQAHVVLQLLGRHVDVPRVPEHPPDQAEEDDDGARVDEQVVDDQPPEHPHHHEEDADDVVGHREPEGALAAADAPVAALLTGLHAGLHPDGR